jgi:hypothetical protein
VTDLRLYWQAERMPERNWKVFVHVIGPDGAIYAQADAEPQGFSRPAQSWQVGEVVPDDYRLEIDGTAPAGAYSIVVGMYDAETMERLPVVRGADGAVTDRVTLFQGGE